MQALLQSLHLPSELTIRIEIVFVDEEAFVGSNVKVVGNVNVVVVALSAVERVAAVVFWSNGDQNAIRFGLCRSKLLKDILKS